MPARKRDQSPAHWEHWDRLYREEFANETDRAAAILSASMLDQALQTLLATYLCPTDSAQDQLLDGPNAPLATFSARINLSHRLGLISPRLCRDLHLIRRIRNEFAHNIRGCTFETPGVRNRILELARSLGVWENIPRFQAAFPSGPKGEFQVTVSMFLTHLWMQVEDAEHLPSPANEVIYSADFWHEIVSDLPLDGGESLDQPVSHDG